MPSEKPRPETDGPDIETAPLSGKQVPNESAPNLTYSERPAGRETLSAIADAGMDFPREPLETRAYGDRISNAPGALSPRTARALDAGPQIQVRLTTPGRETYAALNRETPSEAPEIEIELGESADDAASLATLPVQELHTFIVRAPLTTLAKAETRRRFVQQRLLRRMPGVAMADVATIDVRPGQQTGTLTIRVWCEVP